MGVRGQFGGQPAPSDPAPAGHRDERAGSALGLLPALPEPPKLGFSPNESGRRGGVQLPRQIRMRPRGVERVILPEDGLV
jgi:hypothetical protein